MRIINETVRSGYPTSIWVHPDEEGRALYYAYIGDEGAPDASTDFGYLTIGEAHAQLDRAALNLQQEAQRHENQS